MGSDAPIAECLNCGTPLGGGLFCPSCGQRNMHRRLRWSDLRRDISEQVLETNLPWLRTMRDLTLRPGQTCLDFINGQRIVHVNPIKYLLYAIILAVIANGSGNGRPLPEDAGFLRAFLLDNLPIYCLLLTPLAAFSLKLLFFRSPRNIVETCVFVFFMSGQAALLSFFSDIISALFIPRGLLQGYADIPVVLAFVVYVTFGARRFFVSRLDHAIVAILLVSILEAAVGVVGWLGLWMGLPFFVSLFGFE